MNNVEKLKSKVRVDINGCWIWIGCRNADGYGTVRVGSIQDGSRRMMLAHRWTYNIYSGEIPEGQELDHLCRQRNCVNPLHLQVITHKENMQRGNRYLYGSPRREITHCPHGHLYNKINTWIAPNGWRRCKICRQDANRRKQSEVHHRRRSSSNYCP